MKFLNISNKNPEPSKLTVSESTATLNGECNVVDVNCVHITLADVIRRRIDRIR